MDPTFFRNYLDKLDNDQVVPGFTTSAKTIPLVISKMESYIREGAFIFPSKRLLEELRVFIWHNGKAQAQSGYNDDLVMSAGIGLFLRDTALKYQASGMDITRASLTGMSISLSSILIVTCAYFAISYLVSHLKLMV